MGKAWLGRVAMLGASVLAALLIVEGLLWARDVLSGGGETATTFEGAVYEFCPSRHHRLVPNGRYRHASYEFDYLWANNSLGMRDREHPARKERGTFRILVLGDSFIQGHGVRLEDTLVQRLETRLDGGPHAGAIEVLNGGVFGYSPFLEYLYLREVIDSLEPDLVIVGFFLGNDVGEDWFYSQKAHGSLEDGAVRFDDHEWPWSLILDALDGGGARSDGGQAAPAEPAAGWWPGVEGTVRSALRHSRALTLVKSRLDGLSYPQRREREFALVGARRNDIRYELGLVNYPVLERRDRLAYWDVTRGWLRRMSALCAQRNVPIVLLVIPPVERLKGVTRFDEPYEVLADVGRELSMPVVNLLPAFLDRDPDSIYYRFDRHWTAEGHGVAADVVDRELHALKLLPAGR